MNQTRFSLSLQFAIVGCLAAICVIVQQFAYQPLLQQIDSRKSELTDLQTLAENHEMQVSLLRNRSNKLKEAEVQLENSKAAIPNEPKLNEFLAQIESLSRETEVMIEDYRPSSTQPFDQFWNESRIQLRITGQFASFCRFAEGLKTLPRKNNVLSLTLTPTSAQEDLCSVNLVIAIYSHPLSQVASSLEGQKHDS